MRDALCGVAMVGVVLVSACGGPPTTPMPGAPANGISIETRLVTTSTGPYLFGSSMLAASDLDTLRALVEVMREWRGPGDSASPGQCRPPYVDRVDLCWPGTQSQPGHAYLAITLAAGFCELPSRPQLYLLPGRHLLLQVGFSKDGCFEPGAAAAPLPGANLVAAGHPRANLVSILTSGLAAGLYRVSYRFVLKGDTYDSDSTYLSVPGPITESPATIEARALLAIRTNYSTQGQYKGPILRVARVRGDQLGNLCGTEVVGPAFLLGIGSTGHLTTALLTGPAPRACALP